MSRQREFSDDVPRRKWNFSLPELDTVYSVEAEEICDAINEWLADRWLEEQEDGNH